MTSAFSSNCRPTAIEIDRYPAAGVQCDTCRSSTSEFNQQSRTADVWEFFEWIRDLIQLYCRGNNVVQINAVGVKRRRTTTVLRLLLRVSVIGCGKEGLYIRAHFGYNGQYGAIW